MDEAKAIAQKHWNIKEYGTEQEDGFVYYASFDKERDQCYVFSLIREVPADPNKAVILETLLIDIYTGEILRVTPNERPKDSNDYGALVTPPDPLTDPGSFDSYDGILTLYRHILHRIPYQRYFESKDPDDLDAVFAADETEREWLRQLRSSATLFYPTAHLVEDAYSLEHKLYCYYAIKDLNADGIDELIFFNYNYYIIAVFSMENGSPILLDSYIPRGSCWIDGDGLLHVGESGGADVGETSIYRIAAGGGSLELVDRFGLDGHRWEGDTAVTNYYHEVNGVRIPITEAEYDALAEQYLYLGEGGPMATKNHAGLEPQTLFTREELIREAMEAALADKLHVFSFYTSNYKYLSKVIVPYGGKLLVDCKELLHTWIDLDGDGIDEVVLDCGETERTLTLHYKNGIIWLHSTSPGDRARYSLHNDGTWFWHHQGRQFEYGAFRLEFFSGFQMRSVDVWRIVNDGEPDAEYYIGDEQVSSEEMQAYLEAHPTTFAEFSPLDTSGWPRPEQPPERPNGK